VGGTGIEQRMAILRSAADQQIVKPFRTHGWVAEITDAKEDGEYLVITATKGTVSRVRVGPEADIGRAGWN
jgi:hypothetical protein